MDELRAPDSPALTLLDAAATSVERPNTPRALAATVLSAAERSEGSFPQDLAVEFGPYWWASHPGLKFERYYRERNMGRNILRSLSFSLATTKLSADNAGVARKGTALGFGMRCLLLPGNSAPGLEEKVQALKNAQIAYLVEEDPAKQDKLLGKVHEAGRAVAAMDRQRVGWVVELAAALTADFPDDDVHRADWTRVGVWITPAYHGGNPRSPFRHFTLIGVGRYIRDETGAHHQNLFDAGGRLVWKSGELPVALSGEYVYRFINGGGDTGKFAGVLEYRLSDSLSLIASYGKNFDDTFKGKKDLIAVAGVRFGWGRGAVVK